MFRQLFSRPKPAKCAHSWRVIGSAVGDVSLELQCQKCLLLGSVVDPTEQEWSDAFDAAETPYIWDDNERVISGTDLVASVLERMEND